MSAPCSTPPGIDQLSPPCASYVSVPSRQVIVPNRREHFYRHRILKDVCAVLDPSWDRPTVATLRFVCLSANPASNRPEPARTLLPPPNPQGCLRRARPLLG